MNAGEMNEIFAQLNERGDEELDMYEQGDLRLTTQPCPEAEADGGSSGMCWYCDEHHSVMDSRVSGYPVITGAYLPHSCDEWVIGGREQIEILIADLQEALKTTTASDTRQTQD